MGESRKWCEEGWSSNEQGGGYAARNGIFRGRSQARGDSQETRPSLRGTAGVLKDSARGNAGIGDRQGGLVWQDGGPGSWGVEEFGKGRCEHGWDRHGELLWEELSKR